MPVCGFSPGNASLDFEEFLDLMRAREEGDSRQDISKVLSSNHCSRVRLRVILIQYFRDRRRVYFAKSRRAIKHTGNADGVGAARAPSPVLGAARPIFFLFQVFTLFDTEGKGKITVKDVAKVARELGERLTIEEITEIVRRAASDEHEITLTDFYNVTTKKTFP